MTDKEYDLNKEAEEWGRHFDYLLWFVSSILLGANAVLLSQYFGIHNLYGKIIIPLFGVMITIGNMLFSLNFRAIRREIRPLYNKIIDGIISGKTGYVTKKRTWQTYTFYPLHISIITIWILLGLNPFLFCNLNQLFFASIIILSIFLSILVVYLQNCFKEKTDYVVLCIKKDIFNKIKEKVQGKTTPSFWIHDTLKKELKKREDD